MSAVVCIKLLSRIQVTMTMTVMIQRVITQTSDSVTVLVAVMAREIRSIAAEAALSQTTIMI